MVDVRDIQQDDKGQWLALWQGYQEFYGVTLADEVTHATWTRFFDEDEPVRAHVAVDGERIIGLVHFLSHRSTWMIAHTCYLQDLYVLPEERGRGVARLLINSVYAEADRTGGRQVYWLTHHTNRAARDLYDQVAVNSGFIVYERIAETGG